MSLCVIFTAKPYIYYCSFVCSIGNFFTKLAYRTPFFREYLLNQNKNKIDKIFNDLIAEWKTNEAIDVEKHQMCQNQLKELQKKCDLELKKDCTAVNSFTSIRQIEEHFKQYQSEILQKILPNYDEMSMLHQDFTQFLQRKITSRAEIYKNQFNEWEEQSKEYIAKVKTEELFQKSKNEIQKGIHPNLKGNILEKYNEAYYNADWNATFKTNALFCQRKLDALSQKFSSVSREEAGQKIQEMKNHFNDFQPEEISFLIQNYIENLAQKYAPSELNFSQTQINLAEFSHTENQSLGCNFQSNLEQNSSQNLSNPTQSHTQSFRKYK